MLTAIPFKIIIRHMETHAGEGGPATSSSDPHTGAPGARVWLALAGLALVLLVVVVLALLLTNPPWEHEPLPEVRRRLAGLSGTPLAEEKLRQDTLKLELENRSEGSRWGLFSSYIPFLTAITAGAAVLGTFWKQIEDRAAQLEKDRLQRADELAKRIEQQEKDREQREREARRLAEEREREVTRRFDETFNRIVENLGAQSRSQQASAAVSLATFLHPEYQRFHDQVCMVLLANLKIEHDDAVNRLLVRVFEQILRVRLPSASPEDRRYLLDLSRVRASRIDLSGLDLSEADIAYADLHGANLSGANLRRVRGIGADLSNASLSRATLSEARLRDLRAPDAHFHDARLVSARLEDADLSGAEFQRAQLQEIHVEGARLAGAKFEGADLNNAYFAGAVLDDDALRSIARAKHWREARLDDDTKAGVAAFSE